jgi:hypothetical protein
MTPYKIKISSPFEGFSLYSLTLMCEVRAEQSVVDFVKHKVEAGGGKLSPLSLTTKAGDSLTLYIYIVPEYLPAIDIVEEGEPFELHVEISQAKSVCYNRRLLVNRWSGANIEIKL